MKSIYEIESKIGEFKKRCNDGIDLSTELDVLNDSVHLYKMSGIDHEIMIKQAIKHSIDTDCYRSARQYMWILS